MAKHLHSAPIFRLWRGKKIHHLREELKYMTIVRILFWLPFCLKHISYFHNILWLDTDATTSFLPLYLPLSPSRNYLFCNLRPPMGGGGVGVGVGVGSSDLGSFIASLYSRIYNNMFLQHIK